MAENLWDAFCETVEAWGEKPAIVSGDRVVTFRQWRRRAEQFAGGLSHAGVRSGERVLVWATNDSEIAAAIAGTWAIGGIVTLMDSASPETHLFHAVETVLPSALIFNPAHPPPVSSDRVRSISTDDIADEELASTAIAPGALDGPASIIFTSGSTGRPKGVTQSHGNLLRGSLAVSDYLGLTADDSVLCPIPWSFDYGYGQLLSTLILGRTLVLPQQPNPSGVCQAIADVRPTVLAGIPSLYTYLVRGVSPIRETDCKSLRLLVNTGGSIPARVLADLRSLFPNCEISLNYGLTETFRTCALDPKLVEARANSIGKPIPGVDVVIVRDDGTIADPLEVGEIVHCGDYVCIGYESSPFLVETLHGSRWVMQPSSSISSTSSPQFSALAGGLRGALEDDGSRSPSSGAVRCR